MNAVILATVAKFARLVLAFSLLASANAFAAIIDNIDIARVGDQAEITVRFTTEIQYTRHTPGDEGKFLRVFFRITKQGVSESDLMQEVRRSPKNDLLPPFTVAYPELVNGMLITFAKPTKYIVRGGDDSKSIVVLVPLPPGKDAVASKKKDKGAVAPAPVAIVAPAVKSVAADAPAGAVAANTQIPDAEKPEAAPIMTAEKVEEMAHAYLLDGKEAFDKGDYPKAVNRMNRILSLPQNKQSMAAQALVGEAREKNGEIAKARAEYELYLKLYPNAADAPRIKQRMAALPAVDTVRRPTARAVRDDKPAEWTVDASLSSYFFGGQSKQDNGPMKRDQESLVTSVNLSARLRDSVTDTRFVFRDTDSQNFMRPSRNYNRVYTASAERTDREVGYFVKIGRQNPNGAGVLERFDGITGSYNLTPDLKVGAVYGEAVEFNSPYQKKFYGGNIELAPQVGRPGASLYGIEQNIDGILNRRAVGSEFRYFDGQVTAFGMLDYDVLYKGLNIGMAQANYLDQWGNNYFVSYDYRQSPSYSLTSGMAFSGYTTVADYVNNVGVSDARKIVHDTTSVSTMLATGMTIPVGDRWQFGLDYRMSEISGIGAIIPLHQLCKGGVVGDTGDLNPLCQGAPQGGDWRLDDMGICVPGTYTNDGGTNHYCKATTAAMGRTNMYSAQAIASNLFVPNGVGVAYLGYIDGPNYTGQNLGLSYIYPFIENWRLESNARYYTQKTDDGQNMTQFSPSMKLVHQWRPSLAIEGELGLSESKTTGTTESKNRREYLYLGIRWDYR